MTRQQLIDQIFKKQSFLCVGLDTDTKKLPDHLKNDEDAVFKFNQQIIDATAPYCVAYKPNLAFYEAAGLKGMEAFEKTVDYLHENYPEHFVIADAKRGDIGNTAALYARTFFETYNVHALTVAPYMGADSVIPFMSYKDHWVIVLALTSNPGSKDFQLMQDVNEEHLFERVIRISRQWVDQNGTDNLMYVVGATQGDLLRYVREIVPESFLLVPGIGAQGGSLQEVCKCAMTRDCGLIVNSSRAIIYADSTEHFAEVAAQKAKEVQQEMKMLLQR